MCIFSKLKQKCSIIFTHLVIIYKVLHSWLEIQASFYIICLQLGEFPLAFSVVYFWWQWIPVFIHLKMSLFCLHSHDVFVGYRVLGWPFFFIYQSSRIIDIYRTLNENQQLQNTYYFQAQMVTVIKINQMLVCKISE